MRILQILKHLTLLVLGCTAAGNSLANNITVSNTTLTGRNVAAGVNNVANYSMVQFDLTWDNSWRSATTSNWDAAWVFAKFRLGAADYLSAAGATNSGTTITVNTTNGLRVGMPVFVNSGTGSFASGTIITAINGATTFTVSAAPTTNLSSSAVVRAERIWEHCWLNNTGHNKGSIGSSGSLQVGLQDEASAFNATTNPALGAYFYRSSNSTGTFTSTGAQLQWNYGANGIKDNDIVDIQVFATEMVYVPTASYNIDTAQYLSNTVLLLDGDGTNGAQNNTFLDGSTNNYTITRTGNTTQGTFSPFCGTGGSGYFDGNGDYLSATSPNLSGTWTVECWWYPTGGVTTQQTIVSFNNGGCSGINVWCNTSGQLVVDDGVVGQSAFTSRTFTANTWNHIAIVRNGSTTTGYINGVSAGSHSFTPGTTNSVSVGRYNCTPFWYATGYISNVHVVNGTALYTANFTPSTSPLSAVSGTSLLLKFENAAIDDTRRKIHLETIDNAQISTTQSKFGGASILFDGNLDCLNLSNYEVIDRTGDFTAEAWFNASSSTNGMIFYFRGDLGSYAGLRFYTTPSNTLYLAMTTSSGAWSFLSGNIGSFTLNTWNHAAVVRNGGTITVYLNGSSIYTTTAISSGTNLMAGTVSSIGRMYGGGFGDMYFNGYLDDIRITKGIALYTANFASPTTAHSLASGGTYPISSENAITLGGTVAANLKYNAPNVSSANDFSRSTTQTLGASFPKGYNGFYTMKYELSQQQWVDFFNSLTTVQKTARDITAASGKNTDAISYRNNISWSSGDATLNSSTHGNVACNWLNWPDAAAYADWAGLRPMTELEFEKATRGTSTTAVGEPASGSTCSFDPNFTAATAISNSGASNETPSTNSAANAVYGNQASVQGPLRCGALATSSSTRTSAGAAYYGIMDLSGNVAEQVVTIGNSTGRGFTGAHGNGALNTSGNADISTWPGYVTSAITGATGSGKRGGSWEDIADRLLISDRLQANTAITSRDYNTGFRAARSLPSTAAQ